jgi:hypothetical protein
MRSILFAALLLSICCVARAQQAIPRDEALKAAFQLCRNLPAMLDTPIPSDPDVKRPVGVHADGRGLVVLPEAKLGLAGLAQAGSQAVAIGQLWMLKVVPVAGGQAAKADKLKTVNIGDEKESRTVSLCTLGVRKAADGGLELLVYGKDKEPLLHAPLTKIAEKQDNPIGVSVEPQGDGAVVTLNILGSYKASFPVGLSE